MKKKWIILLMLLCFSLSAVGCFGKVAVEPKRPTSVGFKAAALGKGAEIGAEAVDGYAADEGEIGAMLRLSDFVFDGGYYVITVKMLIGSYEEMAVFDAFTIYLKRGETILESKTYANVEFTQPMTYQNFEFGFYVERGETLGLDVNSTGNGYLRASALHIDSASREEVLKLNESDKTLSEPIKDFVELGVVTVCLAVCAAGATVLLFFVLRRLKNA